MQQGLVPQQHCCWHAIKASRASEVLAKHEILNSCPAGTTSMQWQVYLGVAAQQLEAPVPLLPAAQKSCNAADSHYEAPLETHKARRQITTRHTAQC